MGRAHKSLQPTSVRDTVLVHSTGDIRSEAGGGGGIGIGVRGTAAGGGAGGFGGGLGTRGILASRLSVSRIPLTNDSEGSIGLSRNTLSARQNYRFVNGNIRRRNSVELNRVIN